MLELEEVAGEPLLEALPPKTDAFTYLTILEFNLTKERLPLLHRLLQDPELTASIGWDLVHLLLPLLPESGQCLFDIAILGNPREIILKVAELLEDPEFVAPQGGRDEEPTEDGSQSGVAHAEEDAIANASPSGSLDGAVSRFETLVQMLCLLHPRIKTQYPSRFLLTSISAIFHAFTTIPTSAIALRMVLTFLKTMSEPVGLVSPSQSVVQSAIEVRLADAQADPEGDAASEAAEEAETSLSLLRSLLIFVVGPYIDALPLVDDSSTFAWATRYYERREPQKVSVARQSICDKFSSIEELKSRDGIAELIIVRWDIQRAFSYGISLLIVQGAADVDLRMPWSSLADVVLGKLSPLEAKISAPELVPSMPGLLYLMAMKASAVSRLSCQMPFRLKTFNDHNLMIETQVGGTVIEGQSPSLLDAILQLGWVALVQGQGSVQPQDHDAFYNYLNRLSLVSACTLQSSLRYNSLVLSSAILHSHPSSTVRLEYVKDTLENCPFENLRVIAIGWLRNEIASAFDLRPAIDFENMDFLACSRKRGREDNTFACPASFKLVAPALFALPGQVERTERPRRMPFWLASLNLIYILCSSRPIFDGLEIRRFCEEGGACSEFLSDLESVAQSALEQMLHQQGSTHDGFSGIDIVALHDGLRRLRLAASQIS